MNEPDFFHPFAIIEIDDHAIFRFPPRIHGILGTDDPYVETPLEWEIQPQEWQAIKPDIDAFLENHTTFIVDVQGEGRGRIRRLPVPVGVKIDFIFSFIHGNCDPADFARLTEIWLSDYAGRAGNRGVEEFMEKVMFPPETSGEDEDNAA